MSAPWRGLDAAASLAHSPCLPVDDATAACNAALVARLRAVYAGWGKGTTIDTMRADWDRLHGQAVDASVTPLQHATLRGDWIVAPGARADGTIVYLHGGGFQIGSPVSHRRLMADLSQAAGLRVLGLDYRLAPEHRYPAALDDALQALDWLEAQGVDMAGVVLAGDSAGGGLALSCLLARHRRGQPLPAGAYLMSPLTDLTVSGASYATRSASDPIHQRPMIETLVRTYLGRAHDPREPLASPALADARALAALPPVLLQVGDPETLLSDSEDVARRLQAAGGTVRCEAWAGMLHVFQQFPDDLPQARDAIAAGGRFLAGCVAARR